MQPGHWCSDMVCLVICPPFVGISGLMLITFLIFYIHIVTICYQALLKHVTGGNGVIKLSFSFMKRMKSVYVTTSLSRSMNPKTTH